MPELFTECPYRGLKPYMEEDREYFFGRERETLVIASNLIASPLTVLYGGSGVGKTSVLFAAVLPYLSNMPKDPPLTTVTFRGWQRTDFPFTLRAKVLSVVRLIKEARGESFRYDYLNPVLPFDEFLKRAVEMLDGRMLFIFDQFEEYFLNPPGLPQVENFEAEFARVINRRDVNAHFLLSLREEELSKLDRFQGRIPNLLNNTLRVERLKRPAGEQAIRKPLDRYNRKFDLHDGSEITIQPELVEALLDMARPQKDIPGKVVAPANAATTPLVEPVETPVLQILLKRVWYEEMRRGSKTLQIKTFTQKLGGAEKIFSSYLNEVMDDLNEAERDLASRVFEFLVTPTGSKIALEPATLAGWAGSKGDSAEEEVTTLLEKLSSLKGRAPEDKSSPSEDDVRILRKVAAPGQPDKYEIFHDVLGNAIKEWRTDYLNTKLAGSERRKRQLKGTLYALISVALIIAALAGYTYWLARNARRDKQATRDELNQAQTLLATVRTVDESLPLFKAVMRGHAQQINSTDFSPDALSLVTASEDGTARVWDVQTGSLKTVLTGHTGPVMCAAFSDDGKFLVSGGADRTARVWDASTAQLLRVLRGHQDKVTYAAFAPGNLIITSSQDSTARVWNGASGELVRELRGHTGAINAGARFTSGQRTLFATAGADGTARLWDVGSGEQLQVYTVIPTEIVYGQDIEVNSVAFNQDGSMLLTANSDKTASLWSTKTGELIALLRDHLKPVYRAEFSRDENFIVTASADGTARIWESPSGEPVRVLQGHTGEVTAAAFSRDGAWVITIGADQTARVWQTGTGRIATELRAHTAPLTSLHLSSGRDLFATGSADKTARVWDLSKLSATRVTKPTITAEPSSYAGKCPVTIKFTATITVLGSGGSVKYQFLRSSREKTEPQELIFDSPGSREISDTWRLGHTKSEYGWQQIKILEPQVEESDKAVFKVTCPEASPTPTPEPSGWTITGRVTGRVVDEQGLGVADAFVQVFRDSASTIYARTNTIGQFQVIVPSTGAYRIQVYKPGYSLARQVGTSDGNHFFVLKRR